jgi:DNA replication and repair protein RecF
VSEILGQILCSNMSNGIAHTRLLDKNLAVTEAHNISVDQLAVNRLTLTNFRCYKQQRIEMDGRPVLLTGPNGAGKTNLLEALSFLIPGRGLRHANLRDVGRRSAEGHQLGVQWGISAELLIGAHKMEIGTGYEYTDALDNRSSGRDKRVIKINGTALKSQAELGQYTSAQWLTPQMDRLFIEGASGRRRFLDQIICGLDSGHAGPIAAYAHSVRNRNKLLQEGNRDLKWLSSIEGSIARHGVAVAVRRLEAVERLQAVCGFSNGSFPGSLIKMVGQVEDWLFEKPALVVEDWLQAALHDTRKSDTNSGSTSIGPHRSDFIVCHGETGMEAAICSTGEQKALLVGIVLAVAKLQTEQRGFTPLLLLDEIAAHLDESRRASLFQLIAEMGAQAWITGTESELFNLFNGRAQHFYIENGDLIKM